MSGSVQAIYLSGKHGERQREVPSGKLTVAVGLEGDRHANTGVVTLIELEEVLAFNANTGLNITGGDTGRNIVTAGVRLNDLVGKQFHVGTVLLEGFELCEPCATLGKRLSNSNVDGAEVVKTFTHKAGIRAFVRGTGEIARGSQVEEA